MTGDIEPTRNSAIDVLMREYQLLKQEAWIHIADAKSHVKYFQLIVAGLFLIASFLLGKAIENAGAMESFFGAWGIAIYPSALVFMFFITTTIFYFSWHILEGVFAMNMLKIRMGMIEEFVNRELGGPTMLWELLSPKLFLDWRNELGSVNPNLYVSAYALVFIVVTAVIAPLATYAYLIFNAPLVAAIVAGLLVVYTLICTYSAVRYFLVMFKTRDRANAIIKRALTEVDYDRRKKRD